jgi:DNA-binding transcriptional ArsR family regulator
MTASPEKRIRQISAEKLVAMAVVMKAIAHPLRLQVLEFLENREPQTVTALLELTGVEQSLLSHHLAELKRKKVVTTRREGKHIYYALELKQISTIFDCLENCHTMLD